MNINYFIHTMEFAKPIDTEDFLYFKNSFDFMRDHSYSPENERYVNCILADSGVIMTVRRCSNNEIMTHKSAFMLEFRIDPNKLLYTGDVIRHIHDRELFKDAIDALCNKIEFLAGSRGHGDIDEYRLSRLDITRDVHGIPEKMIHEVNRMLYRLPMYEGYGHNTELEENCTDFRREDSFNAVNSSRGIEFVIYNKHQAALDNDFSDEALSFYKDTVRIELRCKKKYIDKHFKGKNMRKTLLNAFDNMRESVMEIYGRLFKFPTDVCMLESKLLIKYLFERCESKKDRCRRMVTLLNGLDKYPEESLQAVLDSLYCSEKRQQKIKDNYEEYGVSPISVRDTTVPFIQSLDSLLEFEIVTFSELDLYEIAKMKYDDSEVFLHE